MGDWIIKPWDLYPEDPDDFQEIDTDEHGHVTFYGRCPACCGELQARTGQDGDGNPRHELVCTDCAKTHLPAE
jgi:hypothetical protein